MEELKSLVKVAIRALGEIYDESTVYGRLSKFAGIQFSI